MSSSVPESSSRLRSDSLDESELLRQDRKRPRLDCDGPAPQTSSESEATMQSNTHAEATNPTTVLSSPVLMGNTQSTSSLLPNASGSPTSKVTINTKFRQNDTAESPSKPAEPVVNGEHQTIRSNSISNLSHFFGEPSAKCKVQDPETISISSGSDSPEIEVAEPEEFGQDPTDTQWTAISGQGRGLGAQRAWKNYVFHTFPYTNETAVVGRCDKAVESISQCFENGHKNDSGIFREVSDWISTLLQQFTSLDPRMLAAEEGFWRKFPELAMSLLKRDCSPMVRVQQKDIRDFLLNFTRLAILVMEADIAQLQSYDKETSGQDMADPYCAGYFVPINHMLRIDRIPCYTMLDRYRNFNIRTLVQSLMDHLADPTLVDLLKVYPQLMKGLSTAIPRKPSLSVVYKGVLDSLVFFLIYLHQKADEEIDQLSSEYIVLENIKQRGCQLFLAADEILETAVVKQFQWLTIENAGDLVGIMASIAEYLSLHVATFDSNLIDFCGVPIPQSDNRDAELSMQAWRFKTLRKYITHGRMEIRVQGTEIMSNELVGVYHKYIKNHRDDALSIPVVSFLIKFIQETRLINYIVGVDSHAQVIARSNNIVGFLCATKTLTNDDVDIMWSAVTDGQDPRLVGSVLELLKQDFHLLGFSFLAYLCVKLQELPIRLFDGRFLDFTADLVEGLRRQSHNLPATSAPEISAPIDLCFRLLRDVGTEWDDNRDQKLLVRQIADDQLSRTIQQPAFQIHLESHETLLRSYFETLANDLTRHAVEATGSVQGIIHLFPAIPPDRSIQLLKDMNVAELVVLDLEYLSSSCVGQVVDQNLQRFDFEVRFNLLYKLMTRSPEAIHHGLIEKLWSNVLTAPHLSHSVRDTGWQTLSNAITSTSLHQNDMIDLIIEHYVPKLTSHDYSQALLLFIQFTVQYELRQKGVEVQDGKAATIPGMERIWTVILEASPGSMEHAAAEYMIHEYLDNDLITRQSNEIVQATHLALVDRCVQQIISSSDRLKSLTEDESAEDATMVMIASQDEIGDEERRFDRSLLFLRKLLEGMKARPRYRHPLTESPLMRKPTFEARGESLVLSLQVYGSMKITSDPRNLEIGLDSLGDELWCHLSQLSGLSAFRTIYEGRDITLKDENRPLREFIIRPGRLIVKSTNGPGANDADRSASPVDGRIMDHFQELYDLLDLNERLSSEVYAFLSLFPPRQKLLDLVKSRESDAEALLPTTKPYRLLYNAQALRCCLEVESFSADPDVDLLRYGIKTIIDSFSRLEPSGHQVALEIVVSQSLLDALLLALRAKVSPEISRTYIENHEAYARHLLRLIWNGQHFTDSVVHQRPKDLVRDPLETLVEGMLHDDRLHQYVASIEGVKTVLMQVLLFEERQETRRHIADLFLMLTGPTSIVKLKVIDSRAARSRFSSEALEKTLQCIWKCLCEILKEVTKQPHQSQELFDTCLAVFGRIEQTFSPTDIELLFDQWSVILGSYSHHEMIGSKTEDCVVRGFARLLQRCCHKLKEQIPETWIPFGQALVSRFLFPSSLTDITTRASNFDLPVLNTSTRGEVSDLVLLLRPDLQHLSRVADKIQSTVVKNAFSPATVSHEQVSLRSEGGYAGLRNLSNTCYLNSLFTQLFMNPGFRDLVLNANITDSIEQALICEVSKLFASMQGSYEKFVDTTPVIESIVLPSFSDHGPRIDVTQQMDVDEFYNILFDQLEQQFVDVDSKTKLKTTFGGQFVQQIKVTDCGHVSETFEPFSSVPLEIRGKKDLEESLRAYVDGEVLQGDNKYLCSRCDQRRNAMKRACFKQVPDNLIFNLKRFDYDITSMLRCKVNDEFAFPEMIDMAPYTLHGITNQGNSVKPDIFELTGVIVHSGTAETGHYYSFIRQRPSMKLKQQSWLQFNDADVTFFNPDNLREACFGGTDVSSAFQWPKIYSAYMLFYQRQNNIEKVAKDYAHFHDANNPLRLPLSVEMEEELREQNQRHLRIYCTQDTSHAKLIRQMVDRISLSKVGHCSSDHMTESQLLVMALEYLYEVSGRCKEHAEFMNIQGLLSTNSDRCAQCAETVLEWCSQDTIPCDIILRNPYPGIRKAWAEMIVTASRRLSNVVRAGESSSNAEDDLDICKAYPLILTRLLDALNDLDCLQRFGRAWDTYFDLLNELMSLTTMEASKVLDAGFLELAIDLVNMHNVNQPKQSMRSKYSLYLNLREKKRLYQYANLLEFLAGALDWVEFRAISLDDSRGQYGQKFELTNEEGNKLGLSMQTYRSGSTLQWLRRTINGRYNPTAANRMVRRLLEDSGSQQLIQFVQKLLEDGVSGSDIRLATAYLDPIKVFCEYCPSRDHVKQMMKMALESVDTIQEKCGADHLELVKFFSKVENERAKMTMDDMIRESLLYIGFWAPPLLHYPEDMHADVSRQTLEHLQTILLEPYRSAETDDRTRRILKRILRNFLDGSATYIKASYFDKKSDQTLRGPRAGQSTWFLRVIEHVLGLVFGDDDEMGCENAAEEEYVVGLKTTFDDLRVLAERAQANEDARFHHHHGGSLDEGLGGGLGLGTNGNSSDWDNGDSDEVEVEVEVDALSTSEEPPVQEVRDSEQTVGAVMEGPDAVGLSP